MKITDQDILNAALRTDYPTFLYRCVQTLAPGAPFLPNWHIEAIAYQLERVRRGELTRLIINLPPRSLKSIAVSVAFPAYLLGLDPRRKIFGISYGTELAAKHASDFRSIVQAPWYRKAFPNMKISRLVDSDVYTTGRGYRKSTSVHATLTGLGGDCFIIDDPLKPVDAQSEAQRNHLHEKAGWTLLSLPAIAETDEEIAIGEGKVHKRCAGEALHPKREPLELLKNLQRELGPDVFAAQYQQSPVPPGGGMIRREWLRYFDKAPEHTYKTKLIQSWDTAAKNGGQNDWSVCTTWLIAGEIFYLLDLTRGRFEYPLLRETALELAKRFKPDSILIEDASTGIALAQELREVCRYRIDPIPVHQDKIGRLYVQQAKFASGRVLFPKGAPFLAELEAELLTFPQGKTDNRVDSISQALAYEPSGYDSSLSWVGGPGL